MLYLSQAVRGVFYNVDNELLYFVNNWSNKMISSELVRWTRKLLKSLSPCIALSSLSQRSSSLNWNVTTTSRRRIILSSLLDTKSKQIISEENLSLINLRLSLCKPNFHLRILYFADNTIDFEIFAKNWVWAVNYNYVDICFHPTLVFVLKK